MSKETKYVNVGKHTQGPWLQEEVTSTERHVFDSLGEDGLLGPIAIIQHGDPVELEANAQLIAAAPDLLVALENLVAAYVETVECETGKDAEQAPEVAQARAAIASAKGGA